MGSASAVLSKSQRKKFGRKKTEMARQEKSKQEERAMYETEVATLRENIASCKHMETKLPQAIQCMRRNQPWNEAFAADLEKELLILRIMRMGEEVKLVELRAKLAALNTSS